MSLFFRKKKTLVCWVLPIFAVQIALSGGVPNRIKINTRQNRYMRRIVLVSILIHDICLSFELCYIFKASQNICALLPFCLSLSCLIKNNNIVCIKGVKINAHPTNDQIDSISFASRTKIDHRVCSEECGYFG